MKPKPKQTAPPFKPMSSFREALAYYEGANAVSRVKHLDERKTLDAMGFDSVSSGGTPTRYKVWPKSAPDAAQYVTGEQLDELAAMKPGEVLRNLAIISEVAAIGLETQQSFSTMEEILVSMKKTTAAATEITTAAAATNGKGGNGATKKARAKTGSAPRASKSALRDEILKRINAATIEKNPVIHSKFKNTTEKKIARDLFREGLVQRIDHDGQLYYLPKDFKTPKGAVVGEVRQTGGKRADAPAETQEPAASKGATKKTGAEPRGAKKGGAAKKPEGGAKALERAAEAAVVKQPPAQAEFRRRAKATPKGKTKGAGAKARGAKKKGR